MALSPLAAPPRRGLRLRGLLFTLFFSAALFAAALLVYLGVRIGRPALALGHGTDTVVRLLEQLQTRHDSLELATGLSHAVVDPRRLTDRGTLGTIARLASFAATPAPAPLLDVPPDLRRVLALPDQQLDDLAGGLTELVRLAREGRGAAAAARLAQLDSVRAAVRTTLSAATRAGQGELLRRQQALEAAARSALRDSLVWFGLGVLLLPLAVLALRRRIWVPLANLERGLTRVSDGDLTARLPVTRDDELGRLAEHFNQMTAILAERAEEQGRFAAAGELLSGVAHEVNNPLMAIAAHAETRLATELPGEQRIEMQQILRQAQRAAKLLRGLLRFVRAGERVVTQVNLNDVIRSAVDLVSYRFPVDEITMGGRLDPSLPPVNEDPIRLEQVIVNLLSNAIDALRATPPPRELTVDSWVEIGRVYVAVTDSGPGIASTISDRLFHPFTTTKGRRGTGLGLYISRQIAREAGGDLMLMPGAGRGTRFVLQVPAAPESVIRIPSVPIPAAAVVPLSLAGVRILLVEDESAIRRPIARFLAKKGATVVEAEDGLEALERLRTGPVDVIVADLRMPRMDGAELYAELQAHHPALAARVLFLSGDITQLAGRGLAPVPRERVMVKPVELVELHRRISEFAREASRPA